MNFNKTAVVMARVVSLRSAQANTWRKSQLTAIKRFASNVANSVNGQDKTVGLWLLGCAGAVSGVVAIGGLGRLKESRFTGVSGFNFRTKPPSTDKEWEEQFKQFSSHPEYSDKAELHGKAGMTLTDFKMIWRLNYYHYMALMGVPVVFFLPAALFWFSGRLSSRMQKYVMAGAGLQLIQGGLAWSQAKRGIDPLGRTDKDLSSPTKQFRLANHLVLSYSQYILFVWAGLSALLRQTNISSIQHLGTLRTMAAGSKAAVIGTVLMGGMMAATDAGLVHNDWPSYSGHFIPQDFFEKTPFYRNFYESLGTIQMAHRHLAYIAASAVTGTWLYARRLALPSRVRMALNVMLAVVWMQAVIGVTTLRNHCDTSIASLHQLGSVSLVTAAVWFMHELRRIPK